MRSAGDRYLWDKIQEEERMRSDQQADQSNPQKDEEQMQIEAIDWHDFVVVEKIDLYDDEEMRLQEEQEQQELVEQEKIKEQIRR